MENTNSLLILKIIDEKMYQKDIRAEIKPTPTPAKDTNKMISKPHLVETLLSALFEQNSKIGCNKSIN